MLRAAERRNPSGMDVLTCCAPASGAVSLCDRRSEEAWKKGYAIADLDISKAMLGIARRKADDADSIEFVEGNAADLSMFPDRAFDLVLNMDGAVSFCGSEAEQALSESCRVTDKKLIVSVSHRAWMTAVWAQASFSVAKEILPAVYAMLDTGTWHQDQFPRNPEITKGNTQDYFVPFRAFFPWELRELLEGAGMTVLRVGGIGSLANLCGKKMVDEVLKDEGLLEAFVDLCERFDKEALPNGPGTRDRAGLISVAEKAT